MQLLNLNHQGQDELPAPQPPTWWRPLLVKVLYFIVKDVLLRGIATTIWALILNALSDYNA